MDNQLIERNARRNRSMALWLAVGFHLVLGAGLYVSSSSQPEAAATPAPLVKTVAKPTVSTPGKPMVHKRTDIP